MGKVAVMGAGSWGTAFAAICIDAGEDVILWARRGAVAEEVTTDHRNSAYLGDLPLPAALRATADPDEALRDASTVVLAVPSHALRASLDAWRASFPRTALTVSLVKGMELRTHLRASQVVQSVLDLADEQSLAISGPNLAKECLLRMPSGTVAAGADPDAAKRVQAMCHTSYFRVYTNSDLVGVELGGTVKNAIAIAAGIADGMGYGDNTKATIITRGLAEMTRLGVALGGNPLTFSGLAGVGDLTATCMSRHSRNRHVGEQLGHGRALDEVVADMNMVAEGVKSSQPILELAAAAGVEVPIVEQVVAVVHEGRSPVEVAQTLLGRQPKAEFHGLDAGGSWAGRGPG